LKTGERKTLQRGGVAFGPYLPSGHLVYMQQTTLFAATFDLSRLAVTKATQPVLRDVNLWSLRTAISNFPGAELSKKQ
jgi:serine/threonine-protein kinase